MMLRADLINTARTFLYQLEMTIMSKIDHAILFATVAHKGQYRKKFGIPYIVHPLEVLKQIKIWNVGDEEMNIDVATVLHDVVEDTHVKIETIYDTFGATVANY